MSQTQTTTPSGDPLEPEYERVRALFQAASLETDAGRAADSAAQMLARGHTLEGAMLEQPRAAAPRMAYFDHLRRLSARHTGLARAELPELGHPLFFRAATSDVANLVQVFRDGEYALPLPHAPARILDLGAYCGFAAVALARRFPAAEIFCVEPSPDSFRILSLNTAPYRRIRCVNAAVWGETTRLAVDGRYYGDWGTQFAAGGPPAARTTPAFSVPDLLAQAGWDRADLVKCDVEGAERAVFADPQQRWLATLDTLIVETHDRMVPGCSAAVAACFDPARFDHARHGETEIYARRTSLGAPPPPPALPLLSSAPGLRPLLIEDCGPMPWGFFVFDGGSMQLHPNPPGEKPARAAFPVELSGQTVFTTGLHHAGSPSPTITFVFAVERPDGATLLRVEHALHAGERLDWRVPLPASFGPHRVVLQTEMSHGAAHNYNAWARWEAPTLS